MSHGLYGQLSPVAGVLTRATATAVPAGKVRQVVVGVCNCSKEDVLVRIAVYATATAAGVPDVAPYKTYDRKLGPGDEYERSVVAAVGEHVFVLADKALVSFDVRGYEDHAG